MGTFIKGFKIGNVVKKYFVDDTLTEAEYPPSAKKVGDEISNLDGKVDDLKSDLNYNHTAEPGYVLRATDSGHGNEWAMVGTPTDAQAETAINKWLDEHPEATTTVQDGALTIQKLNDALRKNIIRQYDTADIMKNDASLKNGEICHTNGFKTSGDGGGAWYKITSTGTANNMDVLACGNVFANLVVLDNEIIPEQIGAVINGVCNVSAFQRLFDLAKTVKIVSDFTINFVSGSTVDSPTRVKIENKTGVTVLGNSHTVTMAGLTKSYLESINDRSSSGRDIFTFLAFHGCQNVTVKDLNFVGTNAADAENSFRFASPRSICVGFKGCTNCIAKNVNGENILGNVVNASTADDLSTGCNKIFIVNCKAENCYENGFNIMGESTNCMIDSCVSVRCGTGAEAFGDSCIIQNCYIESAWSSGISVSGGATARNNKVIGSLGTRAGIGIGISVTGASSSISENCKVFNNHVADCNGYGVYVYPYTENTEVKGNLFENNNTLNTYGMANNMSGVAANKTKDVIMADNVFKSTIDEQKCFLADNVNGIMFINNIVDHVLPTSEYSINFSASCENIKACGNTLTKRVNVSTSATNYFVGNNVVGKTIPEINAD